MKYLCCGLGWRFLGEGGAEGRGRGHVLYVSRGSSDYYAPLLYVVSCFTVIVFYYLNVLILRVDLS